MGTTGSGGDPATRGDVGPKAPARAKSQAEYLAIATLVILLAIAGLNRLVFDNWITRFDLYTFFVPWYAYLGDRLREFAVPGWNPYLFSGTPFAADPESGWMYLPAMAAFTLFEVLAGFKALLLIHLAVAGISTYAFARALGLGALAALAAAVTFSFGPVLQWTSYCCLVLIEYAVWVPLALLGIELALRAGSWRGRLLPWFVSGFALSQMLAGWVGQGWLVGPILIAAYTGYRSLLWPIGPSAPNSGGARTSAPGRDRLSWRVPAGVGDRLLLCVTTGVATIGSGLALAAAGVLPRLVYNSESNLSGGVYSRLGQEAAADQPAWGLGQLVHQVLAEGYGQRMSALGGAVVVLVLLAPVLAERRHAVPFFALLTLVSLILTLDPTPIHGLFYLIPRFQELHEHDPWRSYALGIIGPAMLVGAALQELPRWRGRLRDAPWLAPLLLLPLVLMMGGAVWVREEEGPVGWAPLLAAGLTVILLLAYVAIAHSGGHPPGRPRRPGPARGQFVPVALVALIVIQPTGLELTGSWLGFPRDASWEEHWRPDPARMQALRDEIRPDDPGGAGEYLQTRLAGFGPFRYLGYGGAGHPDGGRSSTNYMGRRLNPNIQVLLVNGRPMFLRLYDTQGYNPVELGRYAEFMTAVNGKPQNYHLAYLLPGGVGSPLLDLLNLRYILVDATLPAGRDDLVALAAGNEAVFATEYVTVYQRQPAPRHAWVVHDVRSVTPSEALLVLAAGGIDFTTTALVEGEAPAGEPAPADATESALVTRYEPEHLIVETSTATPGLLVLSEIYADGWRATVDGQATTILPTNHALRGIPLPAGEHTVELRYEPLSLRVGLVISLLAYALFLVVIVLAIRDRRRVAR